MLSIAWRRWSAKPREVNRFQFDPPVKRPQRQACPSERGPAPFLPNSAPMVEAFKNLTSWLTTSGTKIVGILIGLLILSQMSRWVVTWLEKFVPVRDPLQTAEAKKRAQTLGNILRHALLIVEPPQNLGVERFGESELVIRLTVKTAPLKQWEVGRELRKRIKARFDERGIQMPLPHRVLLWGETRKEGD